MIARKGEYREEEKPDWEDGVEDAMRVQEKESSGEKSPWDNGPEREQKGEKGRQVKEEKTDEIKESVPGAQRPETGKKMRENRKAKMHCKFFLWGQCNKGKNCQYKHPDKAEQKNDWSKGELWQGDWICDHCGRLVCGSRKMCLCGSQEGKLALQKGTEEEKRDATGRQEEAAVGKIKEELEVESDRRKEQQKNGTMLLMIAGKWKLPLTRLRRNSKCGKRPRKGGREKGTLPSRHCRKQKRHARPMRKKTKN